MLTGARRLVRHLTRHRTTRVTAEGKRFLFFTLAVGVAAINTGNNLFYLLLAMMLSIVLMSGMMAEYSLRRLSAHRHLPDLVMVGEPVAATVVVENRPSGLPSFSLQLWDVMGGQEIDRGVAIRQLMPGTRRLVSYPLIATKRGRLQFEGVRIGTSFPFGLFLKKAYYPLSGSVLVAPEIHPIEGVLLQSVSTIGQDGSLHRRGQGHDLYNLRQYQTGDDSRAIHWLSTARTSKLMVRETEAEDQRRVTVVLSTQAPASYETEFEAAVSMAASLLCDLDSRGYRVRLQIGGDAVSSFGQGEDHLTRLLGRLAVCERTEPNGGTIRLTDAEGGVGDDVGATVLIVPWGVGVDFQPDVIVSEAMLRGAQHAV
ncbi:MAG: DUF58 domain-containing protein [Nitrospira sp.]